MRSFGLTDRGLVREVNEDALFCSDVQVGPLPNLYVVADGMGGHNAGDVASTNCTKYIVKYITEAEGDRGVKELLNDAVAYANGKVFNDGISQSNLSGMGTTLVVCTIMNDMIHVANVGDSRLYTYSEELMQVTIDHSVVEELYRAGQITETEKRHHPDKNMITRAIGVEGFIDMDYFPIERSGIKYVLICSDGLNKMLTDIEIEGLLEKEAAVEETVNLLTQRALDNGGKDNITVILVDLGSGVGQ